MSMDRDRVPDHRQRRLDDRRPFAVGEQHPGLAVLEDEGDGGGIEADVQGIENGPGHRHAVMRLQHRRRVGAEDGHGVVATDPAPGQRARQTATAGAGLAPAVAPLAVDDPGALREDGGTPGKEVDRRQRRVVGRSPSQVTVEDAGIILHRSSASQPGSASLRRRTPS